LAKHDIQLELLIGRAAPKEASKNDAGYISWAKSTPIYYFADGRLCWQSVRSYLGDANLVIMTQENKLLHNHLLLLGPRRFKLAFWGHGANLQSNAPGGFKERFKRWTTNRVDWWFAYTEMSSDLIRAAGYPDTRITVVNNAVDTEELRRDRESVTPEETNQLRNALGFGDGPVGIFMGSLYHDKRLDFLFSAADAIRRALPDFHLLIVGDGPERDKVQAWCGGRPWARWVGARVGREKVAYVSVAQVMLNPGLVGLGVLDAFVCGVPMLTTDCGIHSPEIAYLENGINGVMTADDLNAYVDASLHLLHDLQALAALRVGCITSAKLYTVDNMARRFADGIANAVAI
jgi:L-malate glycosyltransferase